MRVRPWCVLVLALVATLCPPFPQAAAPQTRAAGGDAVLAWNAHAGVAATHACIAPLADPFHESRLYAMMHLAIHDALNAIDRRFQPYTFDQRAEPSASPEAAVAAAAHAVVVPLLGQLPQGLATQECRAAGVASVQAAYRAALAALPDQPAKAQGIAVGQAAAAAILALRATDGAGAPFQNPHCPQTPPPGQYQCTPGFAFIAFEAWAKVTPFVLQDSAQFRPEPPYVLTAPAYTADYNEVKALGGDGTTTPSARTAEQTEIALVWWESSPLKWNRIARVVAAPRERTLWDNARLLAVLNMALADGYIAMADAKNHYHFWRPVTAIQQGETDGNPATTGDPTWTPLRPTPPNADYPSGHSIEGGAAAEALKQVFGTDQLSFQDCSMTLPEGSTCNDPSPVHRSYTSFSQAADENASSRVLIGFHFRNATAAGTAYGRQIGAWAATRTLPPVR